MVVVVHRYITHMTILRVFNSIGCLDSAIVSVCHITGESVVIPLRAAELRHSQVRVRIWILR